MRLTNFLRDAFIRNVANNIPEVKAPSTEDIQSTLYTMAHPRLRAVYDDEELRKQLNRSWCYFSNGCSGYIVTFGFDVDELQIIIDYKNLDKKRDDAITKVRLAAYGCKTLKELQAALPDLVDYMPDEDKPAKISVPMVTGVVEALRDVGFPKEKEKQNG